MRCSLDTNVLVYAEGLGNEVRVSAARHVLERLEQDDVVIPVQCLGELFRVLTTKAGRSRADAQEAVLSWMNSYPLVETSSDVWRGAMDLCVAHQMSSWDALVLNASAVAARMKAAFRRYQQIPAPLAHEGQGFVHEAVNTHQLRSW